MKKKISLATLVCIGISAIIAILALFGAFELKGAIASLLFTTLTLSASGILLLNSCEQIEKKHKAALAGVGLITFSAILVTLCFWTDLDEVDFYFKSTLTLSTISVCYNFISSSILKMGQNYKVLQILSYICYSVTSLFLILMFLNGIDLDDVSKVFILFVILSLFAIFTLKVLAKKKPVDAEDKNYIKITKAEYNDLLAKKAQLEKLLEENK